MIKTHHTTNLITTQSMSCPIGTELIWKSPVYRFVIPSGLNENGESTYKEIYIDVTDSAPRFETPQSALGGVLDEATKHLSKKDAMILDFGAGKLRNTLYFLEKKYRVCAVEFEKMYGKTEHARNMHDKTKAHGDRFHKLVFPHEFLASRLEFDIILLINVCSIMPVPSERFLVLQYCREKLKENGHILWYTQHKDSDYIKRCVPEVKVGDGYYLNSNNRYQTFYRDFEDYEVDAMFLATGFRFDRKFVVSHNHARLYRKSGGNPTNDILNAERIRRYVNADIEIEERKDVGVKTFKESDGVQLNIPDPEALRDERIYIDTLRGLPSGPKVASAYHNLMTAIFIKLFMPPLSSYTIEQEVNEGRKRIDIVLRNSAEHGFFNRLVSMHGIHAPYIFIECKNYRDPISNEELDQLAGRLNEKRGRLGILTYRKVQDEQELFKRCGDYIADSKYIIPLNDSDIITMLNAKLNDEESDDFMEDKMQRLILL